MLNIKVNSEGNILASTGADKILCFWNLWQKENTQSVVKNYFNDF